MPNCERVGIDFVDRAAVVAKVTVDVKATPAQVWQVLNETERWPEWFVGMKSAKVTSAKWDGLGSTRAVKVGPLSIDEEVVAWEPNQLWGFYVTTMSMTSYIAKRMLELVEISPATDGNGSRLKYTGALDPVPWLKPIGGVLKKQMTASWTTGLANIDNQITNL